MFQFPLLSHSARASQVEAGAAFAVPAISSGAATAAVPTRARLAEKDREVRDMRVDPGSESRVTRWFRPPSRLV
ncbi:hypothetical protein GCM10017691_10300 [Pseudonocardia petroleophila]